MELLDSTERLMESESQVAKLQTSLDGIMKERVERCWLGIFFFSLFYLRLTLVIFSEVWRLRPWQCRFLPPRRAN